jgi:hypothetical protein
MRILFRLSLPAVMAFMIASASAQVDTSRQAALDYIGRGTAAFRNGDIIAATRQWSEAIRICRLSGAADLKEQALARRGRSVLTRGLRSQCRQRFAGGARQGRAVQRQAFIAATSGATPQSRLHLAAHGSRGTSASSAAL